MDEKLEFKPKHPVVDWMDNAMANGYTVCAFKDYEKWRDALGKCATEGKKFDTIMVLAIES